MARDSELSQSILLLGTNRYLKSMQCIESIQTDTQPEWKSLALCKDIGKIAHLAAVSFWGKIVVFGGELRKQGAMYMVSE